MRTFIVYSGFFCKYPGYFSGGKGRSSMCERGVVQTTSPLNQQQNFDTKLTGVVTLHRPVK